MVNRSTSAPSPLSPTHWPPDAFRWYRSLVFGVGLAIAFLIPPVGFGVWIALAYHARSATAVPLRVVIVGQLIAYIPALLVLLTGLPWLARRSLAQLGLRVPGLREIAWGLGGAAGMFVVAQLVGSIEENAFHQKLRETAVDLLRHAHGADLIGFALLAIVAAPLVEELIFRGFLFNAFLRYLPPVAAGLLSAILFGLAHYDKNSPTAVIPLMGGGAVLAWVYYRSGALVSTMIAHGTFNAVTVLAVIYQRAGAP